ncbi:anthranilate synthase component I [Gorillibacterium sp. CAU 1737]|uniref:anthranilate synthase component I n=1 Tax=Gorillibacterium sp. CAU 1737 TaxID=3140362 RepID=UPI00325FF977
MYQPELSEVVRLAKRYNLIPVARRILADTETPIRVFRHFSDEPQAFLLESVEGGVKWARYSFIGSSPYLTLEGKKGVTKVTVDGETTIHPERPLEVLKGYHRMYRSPSLPGLPRLTGGAVGFFGYDLLKDYERLPEHRCDDLQMQDLRFLFCDRLVVFDHFRQELVIIGNVHVAPGATDREIEAEYERVCRQIDATVEKVQQAPPPLGRPHRPMPEQVDLTGIQSNLTKEQYIANVERAKEYIRAGDIFQVVLSQRFEKRTDIDPLQVYRVLRTTNPSPYMYYLKFEDEIIVGTSPELFVRVEDGKVETRPIAGTRPRGRDELEDAELERELLADEKERAEHLMLVDLGRNDIGRVAEFGSVHCDTFMEIERYSHVMHIVSNVNGRLREDKDFFDAFISCLPAGTVSGAPKLRAMEIIAELEQEARGAYAGAIGYLGFSGNLDTCITIRTIIFKNGKAYVQAGAGIVWDSVPEKEFEETVNKAKAMLRAIRLAEEMFLEPVKAEHEAEPVINGDYYYA